MEHEMVTDMPSWQNGRDPVERGADQRGGGCIIFGTHRPGVSASRRGTHLSDGCNSRGPPRDSVVATGATPAAATASTLGAAGTETPAKQLDAAALDPGSPTSPALTPGSPTFPTSPKLVMNIARRGTRRHSHSDGALSTGCDGPQQKRTISRFALSFSKRTFPFWKRTC